MAFFKNRENQFKINGKTLAAGVYNWSESASYTTDETDYYDMEQPDVDVSRVSRTFTFQCHNVQADEASVFVWGLRDKTGENCRTTLEWTDPMGATEKWNVTIFGIQANGGAASDKMGFEFSVHLNSKVTV